MLEKLNETEEDKRREYVCSADRSNECKAFRNYDPQRSLDEQARRRQRCRKRLLQTLKANRKDRHFCTDCDELFLADEWFRHERHEVKSGITRRQLRRPTQLLSAKVEKSEQAQFYFSEISLKLVLSTIRRAGATHVLCIGCPSIHERLLSIRSKLNISSFLLDIDRRFLQFFSASSFLCFNMVNSYCFDSKPIEDHLDSFLKQSDRLIVLVDPPFGALIPALGDTLRKLRKRYAYLKRSACATSEKASNRTENVKQDGREPESTIDHEFNVIMFHQYFFDKHILAEFPNLKMMDIQITYANHPKMKEARMFTDIVASLFKPIKAIQNDYKFCAHCDRYVHAIANHCNECKDCGAKDGRESIHCAVCDKCVKCTWAHCFECGFCSLPGKCKCGGRSRNIEVDSDQEQEQAFVSDLDDEHDGGRSRRPPKHFGDRARPEKAFHSCGNRSFSSGPRDRSSYSSGRNSHGKRARENDESRDQRPTDRQVSFGKRSFRDPDALNVGSGPVDRRRSFGDRKSFEGNSRFDQSSKPRKFSSRNRSDRVRRDFSSNKLNTPSHQNPVRRKFEIPFDRQQA